MSEYSFKINIDITEIRRAKKELEELKAKLQSVDKNKNPKLSNDLLNQYQKASAEYKRMASDYGKQQAEMSRQAKEAVNTVLGSYNQNIAALGRELGELQKVRTAKTLLNKAEKDGIISSEDAAKQRSSLISREMQLIASKNELQATLRNEIKMFQSAVGSAQALALQLLQMQRALDKMNTTELHSGAGLSLAMKIQDTEKQLVGMTQTIGSGTQATQKARTGFDTLGFSIQQVARELPSLKMGFGMFALAISNNLPILTDELARAKANYKALVAEGKMATPVWKQVVTSLLSWQTAMVVGITLLTVYGKEIGNWVSGLFKAKENMKSALDMQKSVNEEMAKSSSTYGEQVLKLKNLQSRWNQLSGDLEKQKKFIGYNKNAFYELGISVDGVKDAENALVNNTTAIIDALRLRAQATAAQKLASEAYEKQLKLEEEARLKATSVPSGWDKFRSGLVQGSLAAEKVTPGVEAPTGEDFRDRAVKGLKAEAEAARKTGDAYFGLAEAKIQESKTSLKKAGIEVGVKAEDSIDEKERKRLAALEKRNEREAEKRLNAQQKLKELLTQLDLDTEASRLSAMQEGEEKRLAEIDKAYRDEKAKIAKTRYDLIESYNDANGLRGANKVTLATFEERMPDAYKVVNNAEVQAEKAKNDKIKELNWETSVELESLRNDVYSKFKTDLDNQLREIELFYAEQVRLKKLSIDEANKLSEKERSLAHSNAALKTNDFNTGIAVSSFENNTSDLGMTEAVERRKTEMLRQYAMERLNILREMGTEQATLEAKQLEQTIAGYDKTLGKPKTIKNLIDNKAFAKVKKHFTDLGQSEKEATENTNNFFAKFTEGGSIAVDVIGTMQGLFGGMNDELDMALNAAMSIAKGFAEGGLVGGLQAAAGQVISATMNLLTAKKQVDQSMIDGYNAYVEAIDKLIDKQIESLESLGASNFAAETLKTYNDLIGRMQASRRLFEETMKSGSSLFSHSEGYKANKMLKDYTSELKKAGIYTTDLSRMTNEQIISLMQIPEIWAKLPESLRKYIEDMAEAKDKTAELSDEIQSIMLGFDAGNITDAIVDAFADNAIDEAMTSISDKVDEWIGDVVGNIIKQVALIEPVTTAVNQLMKGIGRYDSNGNLIGFKGKDEIGTDVFSQFKDKVMGLAEGFGETWKSFAEELAKLGIKLGVSSESDSEASDNTLKGAYSKASQESISLLAGQTAGDRLANEVTRDNTAAIRDSARSIQDTMRLIYDIQTSGWQDVKAIKGLTEEIKNINSEMRDLNKKISDSNEAIKDNTDRTASGINTLNTSGIKMKGNPLGV